MLSPVWLQIKRKPRGKYHVAGIHDIDRGIFQQYYILLA